jgi:hypothetical protein
MDLKILAVFFRWPAIIAVGFISVLLLAAKPVEAG